MRRWLRGAVNMARTRYHVCGACHNTQQLVSTAARELYNSQAAILGHSLVILRIAHIGYTSYIGTTLENQCLVANTPVASLADSIVASGRSCLINFVLHLGLTFASNTSITGCSQGFWWNNLTSDIVICVWSSIKSSKDSWGVTITYSRPKSTLKY